MIKEVSFEAQDVSRSSRDQGSGVHWEKRNISPTLSWEDNGTVLAGDACDLLKEK